MINVIASAAKQSIKGNFAAPDRYFCILHQFFLQFLDFYNTSYKNVCIKYKHNTEKY